MSRRTVAAGGAREVDSTADSRVSPPSAPVRTCIGCRGRAPKSALVRVVADRDGSEPRCVPDPSGHRPGRGAYLHRDQRCLDLAVKRRAFPRALRLEGPLDVTAVEAYVVAKDSK